MIPGPGPGTNLSLSSLPSQPRRCRLRHDFNVNDTKLPQHPTIQTSSFCFLSGWRYESLLLFLQVFICNQSLFPNETRAESSYSAVCGATHRHWQSASSPRPGSPGQIREMIITEPLHGDINGRNMTTPGVIREILSVPSWYRVQAVQAVCYT